MSLVGCYVTPHPPIIVPGVGRGREHEVQSTVEAMRRLGEEAQVLDPDTVVVMSPHAPLDSERMGVSTAEKHRGSLGQFGAPEAAVDLSGDPALAERIIAEAMQRGLAVRGMSGRQGVFEVDHGSLVPLSFILPHLERAPRLVVLTFSFLSPRAHLEFGGAISAAIEATDDRVLYIASGDLSHRLTPDAPAGYDPHGREFDEQVVRAFHACDAAALLSIPESLVFVAGECGYRSLVVLFGMLAGRHCATRILSYEGPFGVGYLVGSVELMGVDALLESR